MGMGLCPLATTPSAFCLRGGGGSLEGRVAPDPGAGADSGSSTALPWPPTQHLVLVYLVGSCPGESLKLPLYQNCEPLSRFTCAKTSLESRKKVGTRAPNKTQPIPPSPWLDFFFPFYFLVHFNDLYHEGTTEKGYVLFTDFPGTVDLGGNFGFVLFRGDGVS